MATVKWKERRRDRARDDAEEDEDSESNGNNNNGVLMENIAALIVIEYCVESRFTFNIGCPLCFKTDDATVFTASELVRRRSAAAAKSLSRLSSVDELSGSRTPMMSAKSSSHLMMMMPAADGVDADDPLDFDLSDSMTRALSVPDRRLRPYLCRSVAWSKRMETMSYLRALERATSAHERRYGHVKESGPLLYQKYLSGVYTYCDACFCEMGHFEVNYFCVGESEQMTHDFCAACVHRNVSRFQSVYYTVEDVLSHEYSLNVDCICQIVAFAVGVVVFR